MVLMVFFQGESFSNERRESASSNTSLVASSAISGAGRDFFSNIQSDLNGLASSTTSMFTDFFGSKKDNVRYVLVKNAIASC